MKAYTELQSIFHESRRPVISFAAATAFESFGEVPTDAENAAVFASFISGKCGMI